MPSTRPKNRWDPTPLKEGESIKPLNTAAEQKKIILEGTALTREKDVTRGVNVTVNTRMDPVTGKMVERVITTDHTAGIDKSKVVTSTT